MEPVITAIADAVARQDARVFVAVATPQDAPVPAKRRGGFEKGHPRYGGRVKGQKNKRSKLAQDIADEMGVDPVRFMLNLLACDSIEITATDPDTGVALLDEDGLPKRVWVPIPLDMKLDAAKAAAKYIHPTLQAVAVTGRDGGPVAVAQLDMTKLLDSPEAVQAAQTLALLMAQPDAPMLPEPSGDTDPD